MTNSAPNATSTGPKLSPVVKHSAPYQTAEVFVREIYPRQKRLIHYRDNFYQWTSSHYREVDHGEIRSHLYAFLNDAIVLTQTGEPRPFCPDKPKVDKVVDALKARTRIDNGLQAPAWLVDAYLQLSTEHEPADLLPCTNGLLDLK